MPEQLTLSNIQEQLITALEKSKTASKTLEDAQAKLAPLEAKAAEAQGHVAQLMNEYNRLTGNVRGWGKTVRGSTIRRRNPNLPLRRSATTCYQRGRDVGGGQEDG